MNLIENASDLEYTEISLYEKNLYCDYFLKESLYFYSIFQMNDFQGFFDQSIFSHTKSKREHFFFLFHSNFPGKIFRPKTIFGTKL